MLCVIIKKNQVNTEEEEQAEVMASSSTKDMLHLVQKQLAALRSEILLSKSLAELTAKVKIANILLRQFENVHKSLRAEYRTWDKLAGSDKSWISTRLNGGMGAAAVPENVIQKYVSMQKSEDRIQGRDRAPSHQRRPEHRSMYWSSKPTGGSRSASSPSTTTTEEMDEMDTRSAQELQRRVQASRELEKYFRKSAVKQREAAVRQKNTKTVMKQKSRRRKEKELWNRTKKAPIRLNWRNA